MKETDGFAGMRNSIGFGGAERRRPFRRAGGSNLDLYTAFRRLRDMAGASEGDICGYAKDFSVFCRNAKNATNKILKNFFNRDEGDERDKTKAS